MGKTAAAGDSPDPYFTADQQKRLQELMARWRSARDSRGTFSNEDRAELEALVQTELRVAGQRAAALAL